VAKLVKTTIPTPRGQPWRPGHEIVGWSDGRLVAVDPYVPCGECARCQAGQVNLCPHLRMVGWHLPGGFAPYVAVRRNNLLDLPGGVGESIGVLAEPTAIAVHGVRCGLGEPSGRLGVIGSGALATASAAYAAARGWSTDLLVRNPAKLANIAERLAATVRPLDSVRPREYDAAVDAAAGADDTPFLAAIDAVRDGGTIVVQTSYYPGVRLSRDLRDPIRRALTIVGSFSFCRRSGTDDFSEGLAFLARDAGWTAPFVGHRYALSDLPLALGELRAPSGRRPAKAVLVAS
jgi:threonine dehydrogenase-like Zn-dependent dehydrogenase